MTSIWKYSILLMTVMIGQACIGQTVHMDLAYLPEDQIEVDSLQRLNLFMPAEEDPILLLWIGGGAWSYVNRHMESDLAKQFNASGIAVAAVGHRLSTAEWQFPERTSGVQHPAHIQDVAAAFRWLVDHADTYGYQSEQVFVGGFSSGAHLAALITMDSTYLEQVGLSTDRIAGTIAISGTYDVADYHRAFAEGNSPHLAVQHVEAVFGADPEGWAAASPIHYIDQCDTPLMVMTDNRVYRYTNLFEEALQAAHYEHVDVIYVGGLDHGPLWQDIGKNSESRYRKMIVDFIKAH